MLEGLPLHATRVARESTVSGERALIKTREPSRPDILSKMKRERPNQRGVGHRNHSQRIYQ